jgi:hypothetical protein
MMKIAIDCDYTTDQLDHDLLHLGDMYQHLEENGRPMTFEATADGVICIKDVGDNDRTEALKTVLGFLQDIYDQVEARTPRSPPTSNHKDKSK